MTNHEQVMIKHYLMFYQNDVLYSYRDKKTAIIFKIAIDWWIQKFYLLPYSTALKTTLAFHPPNVYWLVCEKERE